MAYRRLIDARWLTSQMYLICEACQTENIFIDAIIDEIDNAPDVDAVEVVHGVWDVIEDDYAMETIYRCSVCKEDFVTVDGTPEENLWNFCPNCGADMRERNTYEG